MNGFLSVEMDNDCNYCYHHGPQFSHALGPICGEISERVSEYLLKNSSGIAFFGEIPRRFF